MPRKRAKLKGIGRRYGLGKICMSGVRVSSVVAVFGGVGVFWVKGAAFGVGSVSFTICLSEVCFSSLLFTSRTFYITLVCNNLYLRHYGAKSKNSQHCMPSQSIMPIIQSF